MPRSRKPSGRGCLPPIRMTQGPLPDPPRASPQDAYVREPARIEAEPFVPAVAGPACSVCGQVLCYPPSIARGICGRRDEAHTATIERNANNV